MLQLQNRCFAKFCKEGLVFTEVESEQAAVHVFKASCLLPIVLLFAVCFFTTVSKAQSWPQSTLWNQSPLRLNPASSGNLYSLDASATVRRQWQGLEGAPSTSQFAVGAPIYIANAGVSVGFERDEIGLQVVNLFRAGLAYKVFEKDELSVSLGGAVTYRQATLDGSALRTSDGTYANGTVVHFDNTLPIGETASSSVGFDGGIEIKWKESRLGVSLLDFNEPVSNWSGVNRRWTRTILTHLNTIIPVAERIDLEGSAILQVGQSSLQSAVNAIAWYNNNIGVGGSLRGYSGTTLDAVSLLIGWRPSEKITLAYAYDFGLSTLVRSHQGSHEVVLRYVMKDPIGRGKLPPIIFNPRL